MQREFVQVNGSRYKLIFDTVTSATTFGENFHSFNSAFMKILYSLLYLHDGE
jgi:hypothetical protein